ncbi:MAG TPA: CoA-transferase [Negativicutes bacterium]|nr:CoA-transferase [Negativicutes bacterium]
MKSGKDKQISLHDAVEKYLPNGSSFSFGGLGARDPFAIAFEMIRQEKKDLTMITASGMDIANIVIGAGCIRKVEGAYVWIGSVGSGLNYRRAVEKGIPVKVETEEYSNYAASLRFLAGSMNIPFMATRSMLGSDIPKYNNKIKLMDDPYTGEPVALVSAANPDVAFIHVQKADLSGNGQIWGILMNDPTIARAAKSVVITCEEIVSTQEIRKMSNLTAIPGYTVDAVVQVPFCSHPMWTAGYYWCDLPFRRNFMLYNKSQETFEQWVKEWVLDTGSWQGYLDKLGQDRLNKLMQMERDNYQIPEFKA